MRFRSSPAASPARRIDGFAFPQVHAERFRAADADLLGGRAGDELGPASFKPTERVQEFKLRANGGRSELARGCGGPNVKKFFGGWGSFIRTAAISYPGCTFTFLSNVPEKPVSIYLNDTGSNVRKVSAGGGACTFTGVVVAAVVHAATCIINSFGITQEMANDP